MGFRFFRRIQLVPGVSVNLSKSGASLSLGPRGAKVTVGPRGVRRTAGIPGTGLYYTEHDGWGGARRGASRRSRADSTPPGEAPPTVRAEDRLTLSFFDRLLTPKAEEHFIDGLKAVRLGDDAAALAHLQRAGDHPDAAFLAGIIALKSNQLDEAEIRLGVAEAGLARLGELFAKYDIAASVLISITDELAALIGADRRGVHLALAEVHQSQERWEQAIAELRQVQVAEPHDLVIRLSLAELLVEEDGSERACRDVVAMTKNVENESELEAALLLFKGQALRRLGLHTAARDTLTAAGRRTKDRRDDLLRAIRYERMLAYEALGDGRRVREELEKLYAESPQFEDVAQRLGFTTTDG